MLEARSYFACEAVAKCIVVAGGYQPTMLGSVTLRSVDVLDEVTGRWFQLPRNLSYDDGFIGMSSVLL